MKRTVSVLALFLLSLISAAQQSISIDDYLPLLQHTNTDLLFNKTAVNPCMNEDSSAYSGKLFLQERWMGFKDSPDEFNLVLHRKIPNTRHMAGLELEWWGNSQIRNRKLRLNYNYGIDLVNDQSIELGININLAALTFISSEIQGLNLQDSRRSFFSPNIDLGVRYIYKQRSLGLGYGNIFINTVEGTRTDYRITESRLMLNYSSWQDVGPFLRFYSDVMLNTNFSSLYYFIATKFSWHRIITGGVFYNRHHRSKGLVCSLFLAKKFEIGYQFYFDEIDSQLLGGHSFYVGYRMENE